MFGSSWHASSRCAPHNVLLHANNVTHQAGQLIWQPWLPASMPRSLACTWLQVYSAGGPANQLLLARAFMPASRTALGLPLAGGAGKTSAVALMPFLCQLLQQEQRQADEGEALFVYGCCQCAGTWAWPGAEPHMPTKLMWPWLQWLRLWSCRHLAVQTSPSTHAGTNASGPARSPSGHLHLASLIMEEAKALLQGGGALPAVGARAKAYISELCKVSRAAKGAASAVVVTSCLCVGVARPLAGRGVSYS